MNHTREMPLGKLFSQLAKDYVGTFSKRLEHLPITRYYYPLILIRQANGKINQQTLADKLYIDKVSVVRIVDYLSENKLIKRKQNPQDRREQQLQLTSAGEKLIPEIRQAMSDTNELSLAGFSKEEVSQLEHLLSRMTCNLKRQPQNSFHVEFIKSEK